jgi:hypothetical protein
MSSRYAVESSQMRVDAGCCLMKLDIIFAADIGFPKPAFSGNSILSP